VMQNSQALNKQSNLRGSSQEMKNYTSFNVTGLSGQAIQTQNINIA
jgi:hypothetical protein